MTTKAKHASSNDIKMMKLQIKAAKDAQQRALVFDFLRSPMVQMAGTIIAAEAAERAGIIGPNWAGAIQGGVVAMTGLQALKDYGVIGSAYLGGIGIGAVTQGNYQNLLTLLSPAAGAVAGGGGADDWLKAFAFASNPIGGLLNMAQGK